MENIKKKQTEFPRSIRVGKKRYSIDVVESMIQRGDMARVHYDKNSIEIGKRSNKTGRKFGRKQMHDSFWHELVHAILYDMDAHALNKNEKFVTEFASRLSEAIDSARFE
jgi:hypothetical protein